jgi:UDP:flavonoid glycosyltransferase YjiC (YdhE family)
VKILFTTFGSFGDLHPYLAVGRELCRLGHSAAIGTSATYREKIQAQGLGFEPIRPDLSLGDADTIRYFFDQARGTERVIRAMASIIRETYEDTDAAAQRHDAIVTHPLSFAAVMIAEKRKMPWISSVLAPGSFLSAYDPPIPAPYPWLVKVRALGPGAMRALWRALLPISLRWMQPILELRRDLGLPWRGNPLFDAAHSPELVLALFSRVFAQPQPDWPKHTVVTGFPFHDAPSDPEAELAPELTLFLSAGSPPVVFTLGSSAVAAAGDFYMASLNAVERVGARALFLTGPHPQGLPERLPSNVLAWPYAPHEQIFPRSAAIVHQGGIGTTGQALRSGRPMLVVPFAHDQFDNADHARRLGAAKVIARRKYSGRTAAGALRSLLSESSYRKSAEKVGEAIQMENGAGAAAAEIDRLLSRSQRANRKISNTGRPLESGTT